MRSSSVFLCAVIVVSALSACSHEHATDASQLGVVTPGEPRVQPVTESEKPPVRVPVPAPAVSRATDAGSMDEGGALEPKE